MNPDTHETNTPLGSDAAPPHEPLAGELTVNLNILSPSATVIPSPLSFNLSQSTTIRDVKERIRQALPLRPSDDQQRLIYKGRSLQNDGETLGLLMGEDTIREHNRQTFHLVLRGVAEPTATSSARGRSPAASDPRSVLNNIQARSQSPHHHAFGPTPPPGATRRTPAGQSAFSGFAVPNAPNFTPQQVQQMQTQLQQGMAAWSSGLQREAVNRAMVNHQINQNQSARAAMGLHGVGDAGVAQGLNVIDASRGRVSPGLHPYTRTTVREGYADGQPYRVTNTETWTPLSTGEVQNIIRGADAGQATQAITNAMQRSESPAPFGPAHTVLSTPFYPSMGSRAGSRRGTPDPASRSVSGGSTYFASNPLQLRATGPLTPEVYILSSPQGPRALLVNNTSDTYYTPTGRHVSGQTTSLTSRIRASAPMWQATTPLVQPPDGPLAQHGDGQPQPAAAAQPPAAQAAPPADAAMPPLVPGHHNQIVAPGVAQLWQHLWLLVRLGFFVWWLTYSNTSWTRWFTVIAVAITIFLVNTGVLNGLYDQVAGPVRRHVDQLLPLPRLQNQAAPEAAGDHPAAQGHADRPAAAPEPAQVAARLVAQRQQANATWLTSFARRLERAGLLFLASIAPGVAERHIAQLEAEERAARRQREEAAAAAATAVAANEATEDSTVGEQAATTAPEQPENRDGERRQDGTGGDAVRREGLAEGGVRPENVPEPLVAF